MLKVMCRTENPIDIKISPSYLKEMISILYKNSDKTEKARGLAGAARGTAKKAAA
jgi:hypothetical protein